MSELYIKSKEK